MQGDRRCVIIAAGPSGFDRKLLHSDDYIVCADGGYQAALAAGLHPDAVIGDFDSLPEEFFVQAKKESFCLRVPKEKDQTDTWLCMEQGITMGCQQFLVLGGLGGRLDHTYANMQLLAGGCDRGLKIVLEDFSHSICMIQDGSIDIPRREGWKLSVFSYSDCCEGVFLRGVQYPLENGELRADFPLGVSNEFQEETAVVGCQKGRLLVILSKE